MTKKQWWNDGAGFFGKHYTEADDNTVGYLHSKSETLEERTEREVEGVVSLLKLKESSSILDLPCGYGRHSNEFARRGYDVTGIDINREHLDVAANGPANFILGDMRSIPHEIGTFDALINMYFSFGFFDTDEENAEAMRGFYRVLNPSGKFLLHTHVYPEIVLRGDYEFHKERSLPTGGKMMRDENFDGKRLNGKYTLVKDGREEVLAPYTVRLYTKEELEKLSLEAGFRDVQFYGSFNGDKFTVASDQMIMVAEK